MTRWLSDEEQLLWRLWITVNAELEHAIEEDLLEHDLSPADYEILAHLSEAGEGKLRMSELADAILVTKSRLTYRVDQMEARGFVQRCPADGDGRGVTALLTTKGRRAIERAAPGHVATVRAALIDHLRPATRRALATDLRALLEARQLEPHGHGHA